MFYKSHMFRRSSQLQCSAQQLSPLLYLSSMVHFTGLTVDLIASLHINTLNSTLNSTVPCRRLESPLISLCFASKLPFMCFF